LSARGKPGVKPPGVILSDPRSRLDVRIGQRSRDAVRVEVADERDCQFGYIATNERFE
jgi:hypothetical protein